MAHPCHGLAGASNGSLPHAVAHHGHRDTDEAGSSLHATAAPRHPEIRRPPRNLCAEAKPAAPNPPPPRPRGRRPGLPAPASTSPSQAQIGPSQAQIQPRPRQRAPATPRGRRQRQPRSPARARRCERAPTAADANRRRPAVAWGGANGSGSPVGHAFTAGLPQPPSAAGAAATAARPAAAAGGRRVSWGLAAARQPIVRIPFKDE
nr:uncharacterized protein LOC127340003 [Lolium perenne]